MKRFRDIGCIASGFGAVASISTPSPCPLPPVGEWVSRLREQVRGGQRGWRDPGDYSFEEAALEIHQKLRVKKVGIRRTARGRQ